MRHCYYYILFNIVGVSGSHKVEVKVQQGTILGTRAVTVYNDKQYFSFYGVPYARPPIGKLRFKNPKPPKKWKKPLDASVEYHGACAQAHIVHKHALYGYEDCLHLNIHTPCLPNMGEECSKAVIVWIHGYAFASSLSHTHGADFLIDNDVLFISVTHRIGAFGFLKVNDTDENANMGLKDIYMAIKWIKHNVAKFGGDDKNITVMASGSAANFITLLMISKRKRLFSKVILQSGSLFSPSIFQSDHRMERNRLLNKLSNVGIKHLSNASTKDIVKFSQKINMRKEIINFQRPVVPFTPTVEEDSEDALITYKSYNIYKNAQKIDFNTPILIGFNSQESISELIPFFHNYKYLQRFSNHFKYMVPFTNGCKFNSSSESYRKVATEIKNKYFKSGITIQNFLQYTSDLHTYPIYKFIKKYSSVKNMFAYKFNYSGVFNLVKATSLAGVNITIKGAAAGDEICYILKCEPLWEHYVKLRNNLLNPDRTLISRITAMWANFAKFDRPVRNEYSYFTWPPTSDDDNNVYVFGKRDKLNSLRLEQETYDFWNAIYDKYYSNIHCNKIREEL